MTRGLTNDLSLALVAGLLTPVLFAELEFLSSTLRISDLDRDKTWNSHTWLGNGYLRPVEGISESAELQATGARIVLSGAEASLISDLLSDSAHKCKAKLWFGALASDDSVIVDPQQIFEGTMDIPEIYDSGKETTIAINYESEAAILERASELRFTQETLRRFYSDDKGLEFIPQVANANPFWGTPAKPPKKAKLKVKKGNK